MIGLLQKRKIDGETLVKVGSNYVPLSSVKEVY